MIKIICVGKIKEKYLTDLIDDYKLRISKYQKIEIIELKDSNKEKENLEILKNLNEKDYNICMDIKGKKVDSKELSNIIDKTFTNGYNTITFIIGASEGLTDEVKNRLDDASLKYNPVSSSLQEMSIKEQLKYYVEKNIAYNIKDRDRMFDLIDML